jgi:putative transposon-encoded protein
MAAPKKEKIASEFTASGDEPFKAPKAKFEVFGEEMIEKEVKQSGNSGRVYLPPEWVGKHVKIIRID